MRQLKILILFLLMCTLYACPSNEENGHRYIKIVNQSDENIAIENLIDWNDSLLYCFEGHTVLLKIPAASLTLLESPGRTWEDCLKKSQTMDIFIVDETLYKNYWLESCDTIRKYVPIMHRYRLKLEDLQSLNWTVVYPQK